MPAAPLILFSFVLSRSFHISLHDSCLTPVTHLHFLTRLTFLFMAGSMRFLDQSTPRMDLFTLSELTGGFRSIAWR